MTPFQSIGIWLRALSQRLPATKSDIEQLRNTMKEAVQQIVDRLNAAAARTEKIFNEVSGELQKHAAEVAELRKQIDEGMSLEDIKSALSGLESKLGDTDALITDAPAPADPVPVGTEPVPTPTA